ncbi:hypothetical protein AYL99_11909 [Fonsecaea erecta]|uniref:Uncharacterized protein n=1 Tax=Fonsecaea erecta TaxID=1367422 RepID=A0A178Z2E4_9EURO|nr:hypothetical protein AYL99_11909 [Fonsecaea erecta]OAP53887.1 hypothetical protein AYL99_11909 [Fonsecaea erecta]
MPQVVPEPVRPSQARTPPGMPVSPIRSHVVTVPGRYQPPPREWSMFPGAAHGYGARPAPYATGYPWPNLTQPFQPPQPGPTGITQGRYAPPVAAPYTTGLPSVSTRRRDRKLKASDMGEFNGQGVTLFVQRITSMVNRYGHDAVLEIADDFPNAQVRVDSGSQAVVGTVRRLLVASCIRRQDHRTHSPTHLLRRFLSVWRTRRRAVPVPGRVLGQGLTLTRAHRGILVEPSHYTAVEAQNADRIHRLRCRTDKRRFYRLVNPEWRIERFLIES